MSVTGVMLVISEPVFATRGSDHGKNGRRPRHSGLQPSTRYRFFSPSFIFRSTCVGLDPARCTVAGTEKRQWSTAFYRNRYCIKVRPNGLLRSQSCVCADVRTANCAFPSFLHLEPVLSKEILALQMRGTDSWMGEGRNGHRQI
jgi:hypothetical protein